MAFLDIDDTVRQTTFVRVLDVDDVVDLYRVRAHVECSVVRTVGLPPVTLPRIAATVEQGGAVLGEQDWRALGEAGADPNHRLRPTVSCGATP